MSRTRTQKVFIAGGLIGLIAVAGTGPFVIRDLLAAFVMFCVLFGGLGLIVLVTFLIGEGVVRCFELFAGGAAFSRFRQPVHSVVGSLSRVGIGQSLP
jgi:hypothetical protein